jgi:hypothetical protein
MNGAVPHFPLYDHMSLTGTVFVLYILTLQYRHRCNVRTFNFLHTAGIGELYRPLISYILPDSVRCVDL